MFTSLYLTKVLFASTPSAALNTIVIVGPSLRIRWTARPIATTAASTGMIQTTEILARLRGTIVACGTSGGRGSSGMGGLPCGTRARIPDQSRIEALGRDHGQHDNAREEEHAR